MIMEMTKKPRDCRRFCMEFPLGLWFSWHCGKEAPYSWWRSIVQGAFEEQ